MVCRYVFVLLGKNEDSASSVEVAAYFTLTQLWLRSKPYRKAEQKTQSFSLCARKLQDILLAVAATETSRKQKTLWDFSEEETLPASETSAQWPKLYCGCDKESHRGTWTARFNLLTPHPPVKW